jgi:hypothetical protein
MHHAQRTADRRQADLQRLEKFCQLSTPGCRWSSSSISRPASESGAIAA